MMKSGLREKVGLIRPVEHSIVQFILNIEYSC
jgi:hypothetical protein